MAVVKRLDVILAGDPTGYVQATQKAAAATTDLQKTVAGVDLSKGLAAPDLSSGIKAEARKVGGIIGSLRREFEKSVGGNDLGGKVVELERLGASPDQVQFARSMVGQIEERREAAEASAKAEAEMAAKAKAQHRAEAEAAAHSEAARDIYVANEIRRTQRLKDAKRQAADAEKVNQPAKVDAVQGLGMIDRLKAVFGGRGQVKDVLELAIGAGPLAAVGLATSMLSRATGSLVDFRDRIREARGEAGKMADEFARSVPLLGSIYSAGQDIRELLTDEHRYVQEITRATAVQDAITGAMRARFDAARNDAKDMAAFMREVAAHFATIGRSGGDLAVAQIGVEAKGRRFAVADSLRDALGDPSKQVAPQDSALAETYKALAAARQARDEYRKQAEFGDVEKGRALSSPSTAPLSMSRVEKDLADEQARRTAQYDKLKEAVKNAEAEVAKRQQALKAQAFVKDLFIGGQEVVDSSLAKAGNFFDRWHDQLQNSQAKETETRERTRQLDQIGWDATFKSIERDESMSLGRRLKARLDFIDKLDKEGKIEKVEAARMRTDAQDDVAAAAAQAKALAMTPEERLGKRVDDLRDLLRANQIDAREFDVGVGAAKRDVLGEHAPPTTGGYRMSTPALYADLADQIDIGPAPSRDPDKTAAAVKDLKAEFVRAVSFLQLLYQGLIVNPGGSAFGTASIP